MTDALDHEKTSPNLHRLEDPTLSSVEGEDMDSRSQPGCAEKEPQLQASEPSAAREALEAAYTFISQPLRMESPKGGTKTATYRIENYNALTTQIRKALGR